MSNGSRGGSGPAGAIDAAPAGAGVRPGAYRRARGLGCRLRAVSSPSFRFLASGPECFPQRLGRFAVTVSGRFQCEPSQGALAHHLRRVHVGIVDACAPIAAERLPFAVLGIDVSARGGGAARVYGRQTCRASSRASRTRKRADGSPRCAARACASGARHADLKGRRVACRAPRVTPDSGR